MSGFPSLQPAMTVHVPIDPGITVGSASRGTALTVAPMIGITIKTEPGFSPQIDAELVGRTANDYIHIDPTGTHMRLNAHGVVKDKISGGHIYLNYKGVVDLTPELTAVLGGKPGAKSTEFGGSFVDMEFETGTEELKVLELSKFVGAGRFLVQDGEPVTVEYKLSKVVKGS